MNHEKLKQEWLAEEAIAHIHGWDFSHIDQRYSEAKDLPWDYRSIVLEHLHDEMKLLDMDTGGGEFLRTLRHPYSNTAATEAYPPNVELCRQELLPLGIDFREGDGNERLPFDDASFDIVINRHGAYRAGEIARVLKPGGLFITQQVGATNDQDLVRMLLPELRNRPICGNTLASATREFSEAGFAIVQGDEYFGPIRFYDVGALVWFARILPWEFIDFSVEKCFEQLLESQRTLERNGFIEGHIHRFMLVATKKF